MIRRVLKTRAWGRSEPVVEAARSPPEASPTKEQERVHSNAHSGTQHVLGTRLVLKTRAWGRSEPVVEAARSSQLDVLVSISKQ